MAVKEKDSVSLKKLLLEWRSDLDPHPGMPWRQRLNSYQRRSMVSLALILAWMLRCSIDVLLAQDIEATRVPLRYFIGMYACAYVVLFYARRAGECSDVLAHLALVADHLESHGCVAAKSLLGRSASLLGRVEVFYAVFRTTQICGVFQSSYVYHSDSAVVAWLDQTCPPLVWVVYFFNAVAMVIGLVTFYQMQTMVYVLFGSCAVLWRALSYESELPTSGGIHELRRIGALHARLLVASRGARVLLKGLLFRWLPVILVLPLLATVELIVAFRVDLLALTCFTVIGTIFVPVCITGQALEDDSAGLRERLYAGPWLEECWRARRTRLQLMLGSAWRATLAVQAMGPLNAPVCLEAIRRWFGFVNVLLNMQGLETAA